MVRLTSRWEYHSRSEATCPVNSEINPNVNSINPHTSDHGIFLRCCCCCCVAKDLQLHHHSLWWWWYWCCLLLQLMLWLPFCCCNSARFADITLNLHDFATPIDFQFYPCFHPLFTQMPCLKKHKWTSLSLPRSLSTLWSQTKWLNARRTLSRERDRHRDRGISVNNVNVERYTEILNWGFCDHCYEKAFYLFFEMRETLDPEGFREKDRDRKREECKWSFVILILYSGKWKMKFWNCFSGLKCYSEMVIWGWMRFLILVFSLRFLRS